MVHFAECIGIEGFTRTLTRDKVVGWPSGSSDILSVDNLSPLVARCQFHSRFLKANPWPMQIMFRRT